MSFTYWPGPADAPGREVVLVPKAVLARLDALGTKAEPRAVIASANYEGRIEEGLARFTARLIVQGFRDGETAIELPLADAPARTSEREWQAGATDRRSPGCLLGGDYRSRPPRDRTVFRGPHQFDRPGT